ncbi:hypothetical protein B4100_2634 [Heyndrickxia coagulans]|nr:hypothetical protein B4100_2634 [Heyndrickxia coagulans]
MKKSAPGIQAALFHKTAGIRNPVCLIFNKNPANWRKTC